MAKINQRIVNCLWFDTQAEEAARFYTSTFRNSSMGNITYYGKAGYENHKQPEGSVMTVVFNLEGQEFMALNGGPIFKFNEAISLMVYCENQEEIDYYWEKLTAGGEEGPCGWLKDKFGLSWQVAPIELDEMLQSTNKKKTERVTEEFMKMKKLDINKLRNVFEEA